MPIMQFLVGDSALLLDPILGCESSLSLDTYQEKVRDEDVAQVAKDVGLAGACLAPVSCLLGLLSLMLVRGALG